MTSYEVVIDNSKLLANCFEDPPPGDLCLLAVGPLTQNYATISVVGGGSWSDFSDATYIENDQDEFMLDYMVDLEQLMVVKDPTTAQLTIRMSMTGGDAYDPGAPGEAYIFLQDGDPTDITGSLYVAQFVNGPWNSRAYLVGMPLDGTITDVVLNIRKRPTKTWDQVLAAFMGPNASININYFQNNSTSGPYTCRIYQARVCFAS